jgi:hypothetical protein
MVLHGSILNTNRPALVTALAETYLTLSVYRQTARIRRFGSLLQPRFKQLQRDLLVSILRALALTSDGKACRFMFDNGDGFDFIDILAAGARSPARGPFQVALGDMDAAACWFRKYRNGDRRCLDAAATLGRRHSLPTVASAFIGEQGLGVRPVDPEYYHAGSFIEQIEAKDPSFAQT